MPGWVRVLLIASGIWLAIAAITGILRSKR